MIVEYRVLGPLEVLLDGEPVAVPAGRGRALLATLLLRANELVTVDELIERVWDGEPPAVDRAHKTLQMVVARLRQALGEASCVRTTSRGYSAEVAPAQLDLTRFRALTARGDHRAALELWRGPVLANVKSESLHRDDVPRLVEEQVVALERRIDQDLGRDTDVLVPELRKLVRRHPLRETFWAQLMLALHRSNQQAEALAAYQEIRGQLAGELGVEPGQRLRQAHEQVLRDERPVRKDVPRQLPAGVPHFVGRDAELAGLRGLLRSRPGEPVLITAFNGIGGVGKTALALYWAHLIADRFPDGQLYVNLRGFDTHAEPVAPRVAARNFLVALGADAAELPAADDALFARYRSVLAGRQVVLVLDNAHDVAQVRPLLPGGAACLVLVTSRNRLRGLVTGEGVHPVQLDVLNDAEALALLGDRLGTDRLEAEPEAVTRLVARCAGLPLALAIVAARAAEQESLGSLADQLDRERLTALDIDDPATGVRAVFSWSLRSLEPAAARLFVLLGLHPGPDFAPEAAASLAGLPLDAASRLLDELVGSSLVSRGITGRFVVHDLLRDYAAERVAELPEDDRGPALRRMFDHYLHSAADQSRLISYNSKIWLSGPPAEGAIVQRFDDLEHAHTWFETELRVLLGLLAQAETVGLDETVWQLMLALHVKLMHTGRLDDAVTGHRRALAAAERQQEWYVKASLHRRMGAVLMWKRALDEAEHHFLESLSFTRTHGTVAGESNLRRGISHLYERQGRFQEALDILLDVHERILADPDRWEGACHLSALGRAHFLLGDHGRALEHCLRAAEWFTEYDRHTLDASFPMNLETLGDIHLADGRPAEAVDCYSRAIDVWRIMRVDADLADALTMRAKARIAAGEDDRARKDLDEAESIFERLADARADDVRNLLTTLSERCRDS
ncbi:DNA-binding SARP family transcriptional activator [Lentzea atacamensis]|uniref:DNA-binding SARP family transcriptional activator n=1 Tax=Lentzea atacamensis TaxID=531938 RepID=A0A316IDV3_9PSEU|nr:BTAD domain-containing putative transcriptional regulator [Lentzea atacamensis]PWK91602.1 DNA-binding SARP family transcriptional activator [Lentzea atacamensis]